VQSNKGVGVVSFFGKAVSLLLLPLIFQVVYSSLSSFFFRVVPIWSFEVTIFMYGLICMLGAGYCHINNKHVAVDAIYIYLPEKWGKFFKLFAELVVLFAAGLLLYMSIPAAMRSFRIGERSIHQTPFNPPIWWYRWIIPISCSLIIMASLKKTAALLYSYSIVQRCVDYVCIVFRKIIRTISYVVEGGN